jgi:ketosteroid isomerase-like protein
MFERGAEAWNDGDFEAWVRQFDPELEWHGIVLTFHGLEGARRAWDSFRTDIQVRIRFDDVRDLGESVLALGVATAVGQRTGLNLSGEIAQLATFRNGRVVGLRDFASHEEALEAAGLHA